MTPRRIALAAAGLLLLLLVFHLLQQVTVELRVLHARLKLQGAVIGLDGGIQFAVTHPFHQHRRLFFHDLQLQCGVFHLECR